MTPPGEHGSPAPARPEGFERGPLTGLRVIDCATVIAGPGAALHLGDMGAEVIKVEHPDLPDSTRQMGFAAPDGGDSLLWRIVGRNKACLTLDLAGKEGREGFLALVATADVVIENFRPGTLERFGLGPEVLHAHQPDLVLTRVTGFGQHGRYRDRPGFATIAEAMSGLASLSGHPDGPPTLPPVALADELTAVVAAFATLAAVHAARAGAGGQVVDVNLLTSLYSTLGPLIAAFGATGYQQPRLGSELPYSVPRNLYRSSDGVWLAVSASASSVAARVCTLLGVGDDPRFTTFEGRVEHRVELDRLMAAWIAALPAAEAIGRFEAVDAAIAKVYTVADTFTDPWFREEGALIEVDGIAQPGPLALFSATPAPPPSPARRHGEDDPQRLR